MRGKTRPATAANPHIRRMRMLITPKCLETQVRPCLYLSLAFRLCSHSLSLTYTILIVLPPALRACAFVCVYVRLHFVFFLLVFTELHPIRQLQESVLNLPEQNGLIKECLMKEQVRQQNWHSEACMQTRRYTPLLAPPSVQTCARTPTLLHFPHSQAVCCCCCCCCCPCSCSCSC